MPKLPPFALANAQPRTPRPYYLIVFFVLFAAPMFLLHLAVIDLPPFWDEHGQFIPTALDLLRHGWWVARSTIPNVHPPGVEVYLVLWYKLLGYSIPVTRSAMLLIASIGVLLTFLLAIDLSQGVTGYPAFWPPILLMASPLFYMQSCMAQLDMPAMVLTIAALLFFLRGRLAWSAAACVALVLVKETAIVTPFVFFVFCIAERKWKAAVGFAVPAVALGVWLLTLHNATGYWLGNPGFAHYNVDYSLHPVRMGLSFARRTYYLFFAEFRFIGTAVLIFGAHQAFRSKPWRVAVLVAAANFVIVSVLGGAELERYLLPVLPLFYIAVAVASTKFPSRVSLAAAGCLAVGLIASLFWNPPYPFPYENNWAMVDFVRLQQLAADYAETNMPQAKIATAWPYTAGLQDPDYAFVKQKLNVVETNDFNQASIAAIPNDKFDVLITYTRTWAPPDGVISIPLVRRFLAHFYQWEQPISTAQCEQLGLYPLMTWGLRGQEITLYTRTRHFVRAQATV